MRRVLTGAALAMLCWAGWSSVAAGAQVSLGTGQVTDDAGVDRKSVV